VTQIARHPQRPYTLDYVNEVFTDFQELHGDRHYADDLSIVGGLARFNGQACMVLGHQKGRDTKERTARNFGMSRPEGYRKALRLMKLAEKFGLPVFTFVDTPGAYPGIGAEERGQSEAIGRNIFEMAQLEVPIISTIIGEGGSGGALAISVGDQVLMLQFSVYSVISPEGCASILWKTAERAADAAEALGITAHRLKALGLIDKIVNEPVGGAHRDTKWMAAQLKRALNDACARWPTSSPRTCCSAATSGCGLWALHRHQGALSLRRRPGPPWPWRPAVAAIPPPCCTATVRAARPWASPCMRCTCTTACCRQADAWRGRCRPSAGAGVPTSTWPAPGRRAGAGRERRSLGAARALRGAGGAGASRGLHAWCCWPTTAATRPRPCCCRLLRGAGPRGLAAMPASR
jgi:acetyl-CoA carboxylase carboxyl transferase subunit alpha